MGDLLEDLAGAGVKLGGGIVSAGATVVGGGLSLVGNAAKDAVGDVIEGKAEAA